MVLLTNVRPKPGFGPFEVRPLVKFSKFLPGETSDLYANGPESFPPRFFTHFGRPTSRMCSQKLEISFEYKYIWRDGNTSFSMCERYDRVRCSDNFDHKEVIIHGFV